MKMKNWGWGKPGVFVDFEMIGYIKYDTNKHRGGSYESKEFFILVLRLHVGFLSDHYDNVC